MTRIVDPHERGDESRERLLDDLLGILAPVHQEASQPHKASELRLVDAAEGVLRACSQLDPGLDHDRGVRSHPPDRRVG